MTVIAEPETLTAVPKIKHTNTRRTAIITGIRGQDASYLAELLLEKDYEVIGIKRRESQHNLGCSAHLEGLIKIEEADVTDMGSILRAVNSARPHEFYNLAAQSHVQTSFKEPAHTVTVNGVGVYNCLEAIHQSEFHTKFYQASTSELFGGICEAPGNEDTPLMPQSPYAIGKLVGYHAVRNYRHGYRMFATNGILYNHGSPRRGPNFVERKISLGVANIKAGNQHVLELGNLEARRDWCHAVDMVRGMWQIMQHHEPDDFVLASGETHTIREVCELAFTEAQLDYKNYVRINPAFYRPTEVHVLVGDASKAKQLLGWEPIITFKEMIAELVREDLLNVRL